MEKWRRQNDNCQKIGFKWLSAFEAHTIPVPSASNRALAFLSFEDWTFAQKFLCSTAAGAWCVSFSDMRSLFLWLFWCFYCKSCHIMFQNFQILRNLTMQVYCNPQLNLRIYNSDGHALGWLMLAFYLFYVGGTIYFRNNISYVKFKRERKKNLLKKSYKIHKS